MNDRTDGNAANRRRSLPLSTVVAALLLTAALTTGVTFSNYVTTITAEDGARVARFEVRHVMDTSAVTLDEKAERYSAQKTISLINESEVAVMFSVNVSASAPLPAGAVMTVDGKAADSITTKNGTTLYRFSDVKALDPDTTYDATFAVDGGENKEHYTGQLSISAVAEQITE